MKYWMMSQALASAITSRRVNSRAPSVLTADDEFDHRHDRQGDDDHPANFQLLLQCRVHICWALVAFCRCSLMFWEACVNDTVVAVAIGIARNFRHLFEVLERRR